MPKLFLFLALLLLFGDATKSSATEGYKIDITIKGLSDSTAYLSYYFGKGQYYRDTTQIGKAGEILFDGTDTLPHGMYSVIVSGQKLFDFILDSQEITMETDTTDYIGKMRIKGSYESALFFDYLTYLNEKQRLARKLKETMEKGNPTEQENAKKKMEKLDETVRFFISDFHDKHRGSFCSKFIYALEYPTVPDPPVKEDGTIDSTFRFRYYKSHFFDNFDFGDERLLRTITFNEKVSYYIDKLTIQDPDSINKELDYLLKECEKSETNYKYLLTTMTGKYERSENIGMDAVFVHLVKNYFFKEPAKGWFTDEQLKKLKDRAQALEPLLIGKRAPNIVVKDTAQEAFLELYKIDADFTIVYIWSPECGHCKVSTPKLKKLYDKYKTKGVEVFGVGNEFENAKWIEFIDKHDLNWINGSDGPTFRSNFRNAYDVYSTPQTYLLDKDKKILSKKMSVESLEKILEFFIEKRDKELANEK